MNYKVLVGSTNPVKIAAVDYAFKAVFTDCEIVCQGVSAPSGVADQPMDTEQTKAGALNRVEFCAKEHGGYDFYVAIVLTCHYLLLFIVHWNKAKSLVMSWTDYLTPITSNKKAAR